MALITDDADERSRLDALRRRVYGPEASEADRQEYAALLARTDAAEEPPREPELEEAPPATPTPRRSRIVPILVVAIPVLVVALAVAATTIARKDTVSPETARSAALGSVLSEATAAPLPSPATLSMQRGVIAAQQTSGDGSAVIPLLLESAPLGGGTLVVSITSSDPDPVGWTAQRHRDGFHDAGALETVATSTPAPRVGAAAPTVVTYTGAPPSQITVRAPAGAGWRITVAFTG